jgi:hypothetical protein
MMLWSTACETLELATDHDESNVQAAFRRAARRWHPDSSGTRKTERKFAHACEAKDRLTIHRDVNDDDAHDSDNTANDLAAVLSRFYEFEIWDLLIRKLCPNVRKPGLYRRDTNGVATVWFVRVTWTSFSHREEETFKFKFRVGVVCSPKSGPADMRVF